MDAGARIPLPQVASCYFCEIVAGRIESWNVIDETDLTMTILDGRQFEVGQCIVVPVRHAPTLLDLNEEEGGAVMAAAKRIAGVLVRAFRSDGILLYQNNGVGSGQEVPHFHMHVVPRSPNSDWGVGPPHLARLELDRRPAHLDHSIATAAKRETAEQLRRYYHE